MCCDTEEPTVMSLDAGRISRSTVIAIHQVEGAHERRQLSAHVAPEVKDRTG